MNKEELERFKVELAEEGYDLSDEMAAALFGVRNWMRNTTIH